MFGIAGANGQIPSVTFTDSGVDGTDSQLTYTFSSLSLGSAKQGGRVIIVGVGVGGLTSNPIVSVTIGGVTATLIGTEVKDNWIAGRLAVLRSDAVGATGDVVVTLTGTSANSCGVVVWAAYNLRSATPTNTYSDTASDPLSVSADVTQGGIAVGYAYAFAGATPTYAWAGITEDVDEEVDAVAKSGQTGASLSFAAAQSGLTISSNPSAQTDDIMQVAAFR